MPSLPPLDWAFPMGLLGLLLLIPVIVLYLLKPKPKHIRFPSVMFILRAEKSKRLRTFFKKIVRDPLLLLQILVISLLVFAVAQPFLVTTQEENLAENAVIIFDSSASMQATDVSPDRIGRAKELAGEIVDKMNEESTVSIVLAENVPIVLAKDLKKGDAKEAIRHVFASDSPTNIGDAVLFSRSMFPAAAERKRIYVLSDFAQMEGADLRLVEKIMAQGNTSLSYVKINGAGKNLGITEFKARRFATDRSRFSITFTVESFFGADKDVEADVYVDDRLMTTLKSSVPAGSEKFFSYEGPVSDDAHGITVGLRNTDALAADDKAYAFLPVVRKYRVLLITDENADQYLRYALQSSKDVELKIAVLPVLPAFQGFDVIIVGDINSQYILPRMFLDLGRYAQAGGHVVFVASGALPDIRNDNLDSLLPVKVRSLATPAGNGEKIAVAIEHEILSDVVPKGSSAFPNIVAEKFLKTEAVNGSVVIAKIGESPAIAYAMAGKGKAVFMGINSDPGWSNFYYSSSFPIFWMQLISWASRDESSMGVSNYKAGEYLPMVKNAVITSPSGESLSSTNLILDETGFYELDGGSKSVIAVSLLNERESDISRTVKVDYVDDKEYRIVRAMLDVRQDIVPYLLVAVLLMLFAEIYYYKRRELV